MPKFEKEFELLVLVGKTRRLRPFKKTSTGQKESLPGKSKWLPGKSRIK